MSARKAAWLLGITIGTSSMIGLAADTLPKTELDREWVKLKMEEKLEAITAQMFSCTESAGECIHAYENFLKLEWTPGLAPQSMKGNEIMLVSRFARAATPGHDSAPGREYLSFLAATSAEELEMALYGNLAEKHLGAKDFTALIPSRVPDDVGRVCEDDPLSLTAESPSVCAGHQSFYDDLIGKRDVFEITIVRGFFDDDDHNVLARADLWETHAQVNELRDKQGFRVESQSGGEYVLTKPFHYRGQLKTARVRLMASTVFCPGESQVNNDGTPDPASADHRCQEQLDRSAKARQYFEDSFKRSQLVIYVGHSRYGKGPDFGPHDLKVGKFPLQAGALKGIPFPEGKSMYYSASCSSEGHFTAAINKKRKEVPKQSVGLSFVSNHDVPTWATMSRSALQLVRGVIEGQCPEEIAAAMDAIRVYPVQEAGNWTVIDGMR